MTNLDLLNLYEPLDYQKKFGFTASDRRCRYSVHDNWGGHQCNRKPTTTIQGYGFCDQHAAMIRERIERVNSFLNKDDDHA